MQEGERQVAPTREGIRRDHVARYEWAAEELRALEPRTSRVLDLACGVGYGTQLLAERGLSVVVGVDRDPEALNYAREHYPHERAFYCRADAATPQPLGWFDAAVCFETIEHIKDPLPLLRALREAAPVLLASVPNQDVFPYRNHAFHHRHYTKRQFTRLLAEAGWKVEAWWGQFGPESPVEYGRMGRTIIAVCRHGEIVQGDEPLAADPAAVQTSAPAVITQAETQDTPPPASLKVAAPAQVPDHVAIVGLGPSCREFFELTRRMGGMSAYCDEVWGLNAIGDVLACDRIFHMDDVRIQELRAEARPDSNIAAMVQWLKRHPGPVYTSVVREGYPGLVAFPLQDVLNGRYDTNGAAPYFNSTAAYAIAYAVHIGVKQISLFGLDYTLANAHQAEKGRACCEFWLGIAAARGIEVSVSGASSLMDACEKDEARLYGYDCVDVTLRDVPGGVEVLFAEREVIPTAAEIEERYDHSKHPSPLMQPAKQSGA